MEAQEVIEEVKQEVENISNEAKQEVSEQVSEVIEESKKSSIADAIIGRIASRKLIVWLCSSIFLFYDKINGDQWIAVSLAYIGIQGISDIASTWKAAGSK